MDDEKPDIEETARALVSLSLSFAIFLLGIGAFILMLSKAGCLGS